MMLILWVANMMPIGNHREVAFLVSKEMVPNKEMIRISYLVKMKDGKRRLRYFPENVCTLEKDQELLNVCLPNIYTFNIP